MRRLVILGFGGYGKTVEDVAIDAELYDEIIFLDDNAVSGKVRGKCGDFAKFIGENTDIYPAFGNNELRIKWIDGIIAAGGNVPTIIHPKAYVSKNAEIALGTTVLPCAVVNATAVIGKGCIINFGAVIDHNVTLGEGCHICLNAAVKGYNTVPPFYKLEAGEVILNNTLK